MKRSAIFAPPCCAVGAAQAEDGLRLGIGADYSSGDYGSDTTTEILSVPVTREVHQRQLDLEGDACRGCASTVMPASCPGLGNVGNSNPQGRGRGNGNGSGGGTRPAPTNGTASGIGDLRLAATYAFDTGGPLGVDLTGNVKIATADEDKGLGTGANDYGLAVDLYRDFDGTTLFGGVGYTMLGDSEFVELDDVLNANVGVSWKVGDGSLGAMYDWRQAGQRRRRRSQRTHRLLQLQGQRRGQVAAVRHHGPVRRQPGLGCGRVVRAPF